MPRRRSKLAEAATPILAGGVTLIGFELLRRLYRTSVLFEPSREPLSTWEAAGYGIPAERAEPLAIATPDGETLDAWYCRAERPIASALYCHGNTGNLTTVAHVIPYLLEAGLSVLLFDYRGYGRSSGRPTIRGVVNDALAAARVHDRLRPHAVPSILYGYSLGGAIAAQAMKRHDFDGLILQSTFTSLPELARAVFPRIPMHLAAGSLFDTLKALRGVRLPVLFVHGSDDPTCPYPMAEALREACGAARDRLVVIDGGQHRDLFERDAQAIIQAVSRFAGELAKTA
jgi:alpha-beta hydrolase superfamily lysophospholipase